MENIKNLCTQTSTSSTTTLCDGEEISTIWYRMMNVKISFDCDEERPADLVNIYDCSQDDPLKWRAPSVCPRALSLLLGIVLVDQLLEEGELLVQILEVVPGVLVGVVRLVLLVLCHDITLDLHILVGTFLCSLETGL